MFQLKACLLPMMIVAAYKQSEKHILIPVPEFQHYWHKKHLFLVLKSLGRRKYLIQSDIVELSIMSHHSSHLPCITKQISTYSSYCPSKNPTPCHPLKIKGQNIFSLPYIVFTTTLSPFLAQEMIVLSRSLKD